MKISPFVGGFALAIVMLAASVIRAADFTSTLKPGGPLDWSDAANWDTVEAPINGTSTFDAVLASGRARVDAPVAVDGLILNGTSFLSGPEAVTVAVNATWEGLEIGNAGGVIISPGATLDIVGAASRRLNFGSSLTVAGEARVTGSGNILTFAAAESSSVTVGVAAGGTFDLQSGAGLGGSSTLFGLLDIDAGGTFKKTAGSESLIDAAWNVDNEGAISAEFGTLRFSGQSADFNNNGTASVASGAVLSVGGGASTGSWTVDSGGQLRIQPAGARTQTISGAIANNGALEVSGRLALAPGVSYSGSGTLDLKAGGILSGAGPVTLTDFVWSGGRIDHAGGITVGAAGTSPQLTVSGSDNKQLGNGAQLKIVGTALVSSTGNIDALATSGSPALLTIDAGGLLDIAGDADFSDGFNGANPSAAAATLTVDGVVRKSSGAGTTVIRKNWTLVNNNEIDVAAGSILVRGPMLQNGTMNLSGGSIRFDGAVVGSGAFTGSGTATFANSYNLGAAPAAVTMSGDLTLNAANTLSVDLGGLIAGTQYDQISVDGTATLGGRLIVNLVDPGDGTFEPAVGDEFEIIPAGMLAGSFSTLTLPALAAGFWQPIYASDGFSLRVGSNLPADFDVDGDVDAADLAAWQSGFGVSGGAAKSDGDENLDGNVNGFDFLQWQRQYTPPPAPAIAAVPEPATLALALASLGVLSFGQRWR